jgi:hypothetical protein
MTIEQLAAIILEQSRERLARLYSTGQAEAEQVEVIPGRVYTKINRGPEHNMSGMLMIENATGRIYGIKGYGKVHKGRFYGTLDTVSDWHWGDYYPRRKPVDPELFKRTAPHWNCVDYPGDGMHYVPGAGGCAWCGMTREQIRAERRCCDDCKGES